MRSQKSNGGSYKIKSSFNHKHGLNSKNDDKNENNRYRAS